MTLCLCQELIS